MVKTSSRAVLYLCVIIIGIVPDIRGLAFYPRSRAPDASIANLKDAIRPGLVLLEDGLQAPLEPTHAFLLAGPNENARRGESFGQAQGDGHTTGTTSSLSTATHLPRNMITMTTVIPPGPTSYVAFFTLSTTEPSASIPSSTSAQRPPNETSLSSQSNASSAPSANTIAAIVISPVVLILLIAVAAVKYMHRAPPSQIHPRTFVTKDTSLSDSASESSISIYDFPGNAWMGFEGSQSSHMEEIQEDWPGRWRQEKERHMGETQEDWLEQWRQEKERHIWSSAKKPVPEFLHDLNLPLPPIDLEAGIRQ